MTTGTSGRAARSARKSSSPSTSGSTRSSTTSPSRASLFASARARSAAGRGEHGDPVLAQQRAVHLQRALLVVDEEHLPRGAGSCLSHRRLLLRRRSSARQTALTPPLSGAAAQAPSARALRPAPPIAGQPDPEHRAAAGAVRRGDAPAVPLDHPLGDREPEAGAPRLVVRNGSKITGSSRGSIPGPSSATETVDPAVRGPAPPAPRSGPARRRPRRRCARGSRRPGAAGRRRRAPRAPPAGASSARRAPGELPAGPAVRELAQAERQVDRHQVRALLPAGEQHVADEALAAVDLRLHDAEHRRRRARPRRAGAAPPTAPRMMLSGLRSSCETTAGHAAERREPLLAADPLAQPRLLDGERRLPGDRLEEGQVLRRPELAARLRPEQAAAEEPVAPDDRDRDLERAARRRAARPREPGEQPARPPPASAPGARRPRRPRKAAVARGAATRPPSGWAWRHPSSHAAAQISSSRSSGPSTAENASSRARIWARERKKVRSSRSCSEALSGPTANADGERREHRQQEGPGEDVVLAPALEAEHEREVERR